MLKRSFMFWVMTFKTCYGDSDNTDKNLQLWFNILRHIITKCQIGGKSSSTYIFQKKQKGRPPNVYPTHSTYSTCP